MANQHSPRLGKLVGNLQSLETLVRIYLVKTGSGDKGKKPYWDLVEGDVVQEDEFTNYDTLCPSLSRWPREEQCSRQDDEKPA